MSLLPSGYFSVPTALAAPVFTNVTAAAGISYDSQPIPSFVDAFNAGELDVIDMVTGGAAAGDYDNDGWSDLFITRNYDSDILYHNNGDGTFSDATSTAFPSGFASQWTNGTAWGDIDNDGDLDLYVTGTGKYTGPGASQHFLYINDGAGHFTEEAVARGAAVGDGSRNMAGSSVSFGDYDSDGYLDMYVTEWRDSVASDPKWSRLLRNQGGANPGHFVDVTDQAGVSMDGSTPDISLGFTPRFVDFDRDSHPDLVVTSDHGTSRIFWNNGDGTFTDGTDTSGFASGISDMGSAIGDIDGDGRLDWFVTSIHQMKAWRYSGNRQVLDAAPSLGGQSDPGPPPLQIYTGNGTWGWGTDIFDYDNDGDMDIAATNGYMNGNWETDQSILWRHNNTGIQYTYVANSAGITDNDQGRGLLTFDYDNDGDLDLFIMNLHADPVLYRNDGGNENDWLRIKTVGTVSNANGVGAFITVIPDLSQPGKKLVTEIDGSSNFLSQSEMIAHFGLGLNAGTVDKITIEWPASGLVQNYYDVAPNQLLTVVERIADYNSDGTVDAADYAAWRDAMGTSVTPWTGADGTGDGYVDEEDYQLWRKTFGFTLSTGSGAGAASLAAVPEPSSVVLLVLGCLLVIRFARS